MNLFKHLFPDKNNNRTEVVFDDFSISRKMADGKIENIKWSELREIQVITTDKGPTLNDTFFLLIGESNGCAISYQSIGAVKLLEKLKTLPGFDTRKVTQAITATGNNKYICWKRS